MKTKTVIIVIALVYFATSISAQNIIEKQEEIMVVWSWWNALAFIFGAIGGQLLFLYIKKLKKRTIRNIEISIWIIAVVLLITLAFNTTPFSITAGVFCIAIGLWAISYGIRNANILTKIELGSIAGTGIIALGISILIRTIILY